MDVLLNQRFEQLETIVNRKSFCESWSIAFAGNYKKHKFCFEEKGTCAERHLHIDLITVDRWFRLIQFVQPPIGRKVAVSTITCGLGGDRKSEGKIGQISLMSVGSDGYFRIHTCIASNVAVPELPETLKFQSGIVELDPDLKYAFVIEFNSKIEIDLWEVTLEFSTASSISISGSVLKNLDSMPFQDIHLKTRSLDSKTVMQAAPPLDENGSDYKCCIDKATERRVEGWAARGTDPSSVFEIDVFLDGIFYSSVKTELRRDDLARHGITAGKGGFKLQLPRKLRRVESSRVVIRLPDGTITKERELEHESLKRTCVPETSLKCQPTNSIAIIIPVYNAYEELKECVERLYANTDKNTKVILIDDASPDERIWRYLIKISEQYLNIEIYKNEINKGFSATVNTGIEHAGSSDVVLLNSDARVTPGWLEGLTETAYSRLRVATVTPFSDNAGAFSAPNIGTSNKFDEYLDESDIAIAIRRNSDYLRPEVPTGNGFCMFVRRAAIDSFGIFDSTAFPKGYGEENDFCLRCRRGNWVNLLDDSVYVFHERSASFGDSKNALMLAGRAIVDGRYPEYSKITSVFKSPVLNLARYRVRQAIAGIEKSRKTLPRALFVYSTKTGGTPQTNRDLMSELQGQFETWTLRCDSETMYLELFNGLSSKSIDVHTLAETISGVDHKSAEYDEVIRYWLKKYDFNLVHIRHLAWHSLSLPKIIQERKIPVVMSFHDFYSLCPTVNLLDDTQSYCGGNCTKSAGQCSYPLWPADSLPLLKNVWVHRWRDMFLESLRHCDAFVTTSESAKSTIIEHLPEIGHRIEVIPHGRNLQMAGSAFTPPNEFRPIRILVPGNIGVSKGLEIIHKLLAIDHEKRLEFHILGSVDNGAYRPGIVDHGVYERGELIGKVNQIAPTVAAVFSIWDETWCHTLTEMWAAGVPTMVFDFGTVSSRVRESQAGWVFDHTDVDKLYEDIINSVMDVEEYSRRRESVIRWQRTTGMALNCANMASRYFSIYRRLLGNSKKQSGIVKSLSSFNRSSEMSTVSDRVAVVCPSEMCLSRAPASTYIRVWSRTRRSVGSEYNYFRCTPEQLLAGVRTGEIINAIIQRNVLPISLVDEVVEAVDEKRLNIVFDVDDELLNVPDSKDPLGRYKRGAPYLKKLISNANLVTVSTEELKSDLLKVARRVEVIPNYLDDVCWKHVSSDRFERVNNRITMFYMGSRTHDEDLDMFLPAFDRACSKFPNLHLKIIGGYSKLPETLSTRISVIDVPAKSRSYPEFVEFLSAVTIDVDFGVCPLVDTSFNRYKSGLKHLEYCGLSLSGIYSKTRVYEELVSDSGCGVLVGNTIDEWSQAIVIAASQIENVRNMGLKGREWVLKNNMISHSLSGFEDRISSAFNGCSMENTSNTVRMVS